MTPAAVIFTSVSCRYGRATVVDTVQLGVAAGEHVVLTGANGSGKTTLLRAALGLHPLAGGTVSVDGQSARTPADWVRRRREVALCSGVNADRLVLVLLVVTAVAIGGAIQLTGALLVDALTLLPALGARNLGRSLRSIVIWAIVLGLLGNAVGFVVALAIDQPLGPVLVLVAGALTLLTYLVPGGALDALTPSRPGDRPAGVSHSPAERLQQH